MRFLITGAAGFLGAPLANSLVTENHSVMGLDDLSTGDPKQLVDAVHLERGDINDRPKLWSLLQGVDCVYHLAARVIVPESVLYPREYNTVNVGGTVTLMEAMRDVGVQARDLYFFRHNLWKSETPTRQGIKPPKSTLSICGLQIGS